MARAALPMCQREVPQTGGLEPKWRRVVCARVAHRHTTSGLEKDESNELFIACYTTDSKNRYWSRKAWADTEFFAKVTNETHGLP